MNSVAEEIELHHKPAKMLLVTSKKTRFWGKIICGKCPLMSPSGAPIQSHRNYFRNGDIFVVDISNKHAIIFVVVKQHALIFPRLGFSDGLPETVYQRV